MHRAWFLFGAVMAFLAAAPAGARHEKPARVYKQLSATMHCPKPDPSALSAVAITCTYSRGEIAGEAISREEDVFASDMYRGTSQAVSSALERGEVAGEVLRLGRGRSHHDGNGVITLANGDTVKIHFSGTTLFSGARPSKGQGTWKLTGGTGKGKSIKGSGRYSGTFEGDGSASWLITGKYAVSGGQ